jgi:hypothetical protein
MCDYSDLTDEDLCTDYAGVGLADGCPADPEPYCGTNDTDLCDVCGGNNECLYGTGDVNIDGVVDVLDLLDLVYHILGTDLLEGLEFDIANINGDGILDILDLVDIVAMILGDDIMSRKVTNVNLIDICNFTRHNIIA